MYIIILNTHTRISQYISLLKLLNYHYDRYVQLYDKNINTWKSGVVRALKTFIPDGTKIGDRICLECETEGLVYEEGCLKCINCGYTKCG